MDMIKLASTTTDISLLEKLSVDTNKDVRLAVFNNPKQYLIIQIHHLN